MMGSLLHFCSAAGGHPFPGYVTIQRNTCTDILLQKRNKNSSAGQSGVSDKTSSLATLGELGGYPVMLNGYV